MLKVGTLYFDLLDSSIFIINQHMMLHDSDGWKYNYYNVESYLCHAESVPTMHKSFTKGKKFLIEGMGRWSL